jgi:hypothetical protein
LCALPLPHLTRSPLTLVANPPHCSCCGVRKAREGWRGSASHAPWVAQEATEAARNAAIKVAQGKSKQLDEQKAARVEAKHDLDRQKLANKAQHLSVERERLRQQDADRAKRTLQVRAP